MKYAVLFMSAVAALLLCGCEQLRLAEGKYSTVISGREDFVLVCGDRIAVRLRNPENEDGPVTGYWNWIGTYHIEDNRIWLDMDKATGKKWNFYYNLYVLPNGISVSDLRAENSFSLHFSRDDMPPARRPAGINAPAMKNDGGSVYR